MKDLSDDDLLTKHARLSQQLEARNAKIGELWATDNKKFQKKFGKHGPKNEHFETILNELKQEIDNRNLNQETK